ncbi:MAG TPA: DUF2818 family protein [Gammaproteobacteria bacterium]
MSATVAAWLLIAVALVCANLPWLSDRLLLVVRPAQGVKRGWWRWGEWLLLYLLTGVVALGLEQKLNGERYPQGWEFYVVTFCIFMVFALPGFIYRYDLRHYFRRS